MALSFIRDNDAIVKVGSGLAVCFEADSEGTTTGSVVKLPFIKASVLKDETEVEELKKEGSETVSVGGKRSVTWEVTFMQRDKETVMMAVETLRDKYIQIVKEITETKIHNDNYQYLFIPIAKVQPKLEMAADSEEIKVTFDVLAVQSVVGNQAIATSDSGFKLALTSSEVTCDTAGKKYWNIVESSS